MVNLGSGGASPKVMNALIIIIAVVWALSFLLEAIIPDKFNPPSSVTEIMMIVVGYLFARKTQGGDEEDDEKESAEKGAK